jgi:membrane protease YdiL (CAAX protease family)
LERFQALFEVLLISGLISSFLAALPFSLIMGKKFHLLTSDVQLISVFLLLESGITFMMLKILLKARGQGIADLGWRREQWEPNLLLGLVLVPFLFLINAGVSFIFRTYLPKYYLEQNPLIEMVQTPQQLVLFAFAALVAGGIKEELQRAFILNHFRRYLGGAAAGLVLWSAAFGAGHYVQGVQGVFLAAVYGLIFGSIYILRGSVIAPVAAHGAYDTLALIGYWIFSGQFK